MSAAVSIHNLTKDFGAVRALNDVTLDVPYGSLFGLLGPNGAGKTTLFSVAAGFLSPTKGSVDVLGIDARETSRLRGRYSMLPQDAAFQGGIPVLDQLVMFARLTGCSREEAVTRSQEALELVGLGEVMRKSARTLSHGMMKRVALCQAFLGRPEVIFLDEPTSGLDPDTARKIRELIRTSHEDRTVVISSHNLREIQDMCDHVAILDHGRLVADADMADLTSASYLLRISLGEPLTAEAEAGIRALAGVSSVERTGDLDFNVELALDSGAEKDEALKRLQKLLIVEHDLAVRAIHEGASLEARFLEMTGGTYDGSSST